jgi:rhomboid family protein
MLPLWDNTPRRRAPVATAALLAANAAVFVHEAQLALAGRLMPFIQAHALVPRRLVAGWADGAQWLTVLTHMFLHGSVAHVLGNCWFLWIFGRSVEDRLGTLRFVLLYFAAGVAAAALQVAFTPDAAAPMLGASGAISGVLGAYLVLLPAAWIMTLVPWIVPILPVPAVVFLVLWFVIQAFNGFGTLFDQSAGGGVAWWAHAGGFLAGAVLTLAAGRGRPRR